MNRGTTTLLTSVVERPVDGQIMTKLSGERDQAALVAAVVENYHRLTGEPKLDVDAVLAERIGQRVTLILAGETMFGGGVIAACEGTLFRGQRGIGLLPKGARTKGKLVSPEKVLDVLAGWVGPTAKGLIDQARAHYPQLEPLTQEHFAALPAASHDCSLAIFGHWPMPDCHSYDAIWLLGEYDSANDIADCAVLLLRPEHGFSEHGSVFGRQLLNLNVGVVTGFKPIPFAEALTLCDREYDEAARAVFARVSS
jgi:hypothetical protein